MMNNVEKSKVKLFIDNNPIPIAEFSTPVNFELDTRKLPDGEHELKIVSKSHTGKEGIKIMKFEVRNGPAISIEGLENNSIVNGVLPLMINAYDQGNHKNFVITGSETPQSVPSWLWLLIILFVGWAAYYFIVYYKIR